MKRLFEPLNFDGRKLVWDYRKRITQNYNGFYHWHQCCEVLLVHEGQGSIVLNGEQFPIQRGMLFFFQPFQLHHVYANVSESQPYERSIFYFDPALTEDMLRSFPKRHAFYLNVWKGQNKAQAYDLSSFIERLEHYYAEHEQARKEGRGLDSEEISLLLLRLVDCLMQSGQHNHERSFTTNPERKQVQYAKDAMRWMDEHYAEEFNLDSLAKELFLSKSYVSKMFKEETGSTLRDYLTARRMNKACRLLETTTMSIEQIGSEVGIPNASYFVQLFKKIVGTTPLQYRMSV